MSLFKKKVEVEVVDSSTLRDRSNSVLSVFRSTISGLREVNQKAVSKIAEKTVIIQEAEKERDELATLVEENATVIDKINSFFVSE